MSADHQTQYLHKEIVSGGTYDIIFQQAAAKLFVRSGFLDAAAFLDEAWVTTKLAST